MNNYEKIYWLTRLDSINGFLIGLTILSVVATVIITVVIIEKKSADGYSWNKDLKPARAMFRKKLGRWRWLTVPLLIIGSLGVVFLPTKNEMLMIYAGGTTMNYVQKDTSLSKVPYQTTAVISEYLDKTLKELKNENKK